MRNSLIRQYQLLKDELYVPDVVLDTLKWTKSEDSEDSYRQQLIEKFKEKILNIPLLRALLLLIIKLVVVGHCNAWKL